MPWELTRKDPIVDVRLLFRRQFGIAFLVMMAVGAVLFGSTQLLPQLLQTDFGYTALLSGLALMPGGAGDAGDDAVRRQDRRVSCSQNI